MNTQENPSSRQHHHTHTHTVEWVVLIARRKNQSVASKFFVKEILLVTLLVSWLPLFFSLCFFLLLQHGDDDEALKHKNKNEDQISFVFQPIVVDYIWWKYSSK
jgi:hypothetical protein